MVAHPPCAQWSRLKGLARRNESEAWLGVWCYELVRKWGGVLEHPAHSELWKYVGVRPVVVSARWFGHRAEKLTGFFFAGLREFPRPAFSFVPASRCVATTLRGVGRLPALDKREAAGTPREMAEWLVDAARGVDSTLLDGYCAR